MVQDFLEFSGAFIAIVKLKIGEAAGIDRPISDARGRRTQFIFSGELEGGEGFRGLVLMKKNQSSNGGRGKIRKQTIRGKFSV